jgi:Calcineurin-like phosphoesterase
VPNSPDLRAMQGPFDIIGDIHGCADEFVALLDQLGYRVRWGGGREPRSASVTPPAGRTLVLVGDLVDRGPNSPDVLHIVMGMVSRGQAICVPGNHDAKFLRWLEGRNVVISHGLDTTIAQIAQQPATWREEVRRFLSELPLYAWLDEGRLVVAHAGIQDHMLGRTDQRTRSFCLYGDTAGGKLDGDGLPIRYHWAARYRGAAAIVYGHTPVESASWVNNTLCLDTGCTFGGRLSALRWPERRIVSVPCVRTYAARSRPFGHPPLRPDAGSD